MKNTTVSVSLAPRYTAILRRLRRSGRYQTDSEVMRAALERLEETEWDPNAYPPGSLACLYTPARNREELQLNKVSSLKVERDE
ncbi:MAG: type II toxin-antitoxin system ParD family antitoxin [Verrucomicrobia bacterium]|nr:type II toxin-antitoxin system ParD family antitoxin [Verrucomicrobiota bacterium]